MSWFHSFKMSWYRVFQEDRDGLAGSRRRLVVGNLFSSLGSSITAGIFYTALILVLFRGESESLRNEYLGNIAMLQTAAGFLQMVAPQILERLKNRKRYIMGLRWLYHFLNIFCLGVIPILPLEIHWKANLFLVVATLMSASVALYTPGLQAWHIYPVSEQCRSDYFTISSILGNVMTHSVSLFASVFMDFFAKDAQEYTAILIMRGVALLAIAMETKNYWQIKEPEYHVSEKKPSFLEILSVPFRHPMYLLNLVIGGLWASFTATLGSYYSAYLLADAKVSYSLLGIMNIASVPMTMLGLPIWNQLIRRFGWYRPMAVSWLLFGAIYGINGLVTEESKWLYGVGTVLCAFVMGGYSLGGANLPYFNAPKEGLSSCLAFYSTFSSIMGFVGAWVGKVFIRETEGKIIEVFGLELKNGAYVSFIPFFGSFLVSALILVVYFVDKKKQAMQAQTVGA